MRALAAIPLALALAGCNPGRDNGYVEIRTVSVYGAPPELYLDEVKVDGLRSGTAVVRKTAGSVILRLLKAETFYPLCAFEVRKNRVVTLTVAIVANKFKCDVQT